MKRFRAGEAGVVAIEMALMFPVFILVMWFGSEAAYHYRVENSLHRATASLAEIIANTRLTKATENTEAETLGDRLPVLLEPALTALRRMMGADAETPVGLRISWYKTPVPNSSAGEDPPLVLATGLQCPEGALSPLNSLSYEGGGGLTTEENVAKTELVRVETCYQAKERWNVEKWVFPRDFTSNFITLRKDW